MKLQFYTYQNSQPAQFTHWVLLYKKIPFEAHFLDPFKGEFKAESYLKISPRGKVPAISLGDFNLYESWAIFEFLEERFPDRPLLPSNGFARAKAQCRFAEFYCYFFNYAAQYLVTGYFKPREKWNLKMMESLSNKIQSELQFWNNLFQGPWIFPQISGLDFALYPLIKSLNRLAKKYPEDINWALEPTFNETYPKIAKFKNSIETLPEYSDILENYGNSL